MTKNVAAATGKAPPLNKERGDVAIKLRRKGVWMHAKLVPEYTAIVEIEHATGKSFVQLARETALGARGFNPYIGDLAVIITAGLNAGEQSLGTDVLTVGDMLIETGPIEEHVLGSVAEFIGNCLAGNERRRQAIEAEAKKGGAPGEGAPAAGPAKSESPSSGSSA